MLDERPYDAGSPFRTQREFPAAAVFKDIHFFLDHVCGFAEGTLKKIDGFKGRGPDLREPEALEKAPSGIFQGLKLSRIGRKDILGAANRLIFHHGAELYNLT